MWEVFGIIRIDCEIHHIFGRKSKAHKHDCANLIYINRDLHYAYHHQGLYTYAGVTMYAQDMKEWFIRYNSKWYGIEAVERCK